METELLKALKTAITYLKTGYYDEQGIKDLQETVKCAEEREHSVVEIKHMGFVK
jgi:hypothetical protein